MSRDEIPLSGGNVADSVVRVGQTVRKPQTTSTAATKALLDQLETATIDGVPRFLGIDHQNRQILSYMPGETAFPANIWDTEHTLTSAAKLLRHIHDASRPLLGADHKWAYSYPDATLHEVIGHSDFAPYNMTFNADGAVTGVFDFDLAGPAPRTRDLAYLAWWLVPLGQQDPGMRTATRADLKNQCNRLKLICKTYGITADAAFVDMIDHVLHHMSDPDIARATIGDAATQSLIEGGHLAHWRRERDHFAQIAPRIRANLGL